MEGFGKHDVHHAGQISLPKVKTSAYLTAFTDPMPVCHSTIRTQTTTDMRTEISRLECSKGELANLSSCTSKIQFKFYLGLCAEKQVNNVHQASINDINHDMYMTWMLKAGQKT